jgi:hypothetical protein
MEKFKNFLSNIKPVDFIIVAGVVIALIVGFVTFKHVRQTADKQIEATSKISFQIISIRNVPYSDLDILDVKAERKKVVLPILNSKKVMVVEDVSQSNMYDIIVTLTDTAKITKDGAVVGGNKIKIGLPITLEGEDYKFTGTVSDLKVIPDDNFHNSINANDDI